VLHRQPCAELEQRLAVAVVELVENRSPRGRRKRMEHIAQCPGIIGKSLLAYAAERERAESQGRFRGSFSTYVT
jgi:hypothetical protein